MAAALALGECRDPVLAVALAPLLKDHHRPVRLAAAAALLTGGSCDSVRTDAPIEGEAAPPRIGETEDAREWISRLLANHAPVVATLGTLPSLASISDLGPSDWTRIFAGEMPDELPADPRAEMARYAEEAENRHNLTKPFTPGPRDQNTRLLHSFLALAEHMEVPQGGRVLDLGGGAGWVSELLFKLGYRPVTLDVSTTLLALAQVRFAREQIPARLAAADLTALPFRDGEFESVVVFDALHHVGDIAAAFREAYRVLAEGGQFLLAEPGEGHSESEKSRGERTEYGVREGEIHVFETVDIALAAGFQRPRVIAHYVPAVYFTPQDLSDALEQPAESWRIRHPTGRTARIDEYILQSIFSHPILAFSKGERAVDSRAPRQLRAKLGPALVRAGLHVSGVVRVTNIGDTVWLRGSDAGHVRLGLQLLTPERTILQRDYARADLPSDVAASAMVEVQIAVVLPDSNARYVLKLDLVDEQICWFEDVGSTPVYVAL
jgi:SAM-dependent methyltransferase